MESTLENSTSIYKGPYFSHCKMYLTIVGLWPFAKSRYILKMIMGVLMVASMIPLMLGAVLHLDNVDRVMLCCVALVVMISEFLKLVSLTLSGKKMKELFVDLQINWNQINEPEEKQILINYAKTGKTITSAYAFYMVFSGTTIALSPLTTRFLDLINPLESPRPPVYLLEGEYKVDREAHFWPLFCCDTLSTALATIMTLAADNTYFVVSQQSCALYAIVVHRLRKLTPRGSDLSHQNSTDETDSYKWLAQTVQFHRIALNYTDVISEGYSMAFFFILLTNVFGIPLTVCAILAGEGGILSLTFASLLVSLLIHLFFIFYVGQNIITHGEKLWENVCNNEWYLTPLRTKKLLMIFMIRCSQPSSLDAGRILKIDFVTYASILRSSASYITVLLSFR